MRTVTAGPLRCGLIVMGSWSTATVVAREAITRRGEVRVRLLKVSQSSFLRSVHLFHVAHLFLLDGLQ